MSLIKCAYVGEKFKIYNEGFEDGRDRERDEILTFLTEMKEKMEKYTEFKNRIGAISIGFVIRLLNSAVGTRKEREELKERLEVKDDI